jgi:hypothetical protein
MKFNSLVRKAYKHYSQKQRKTDRRIVDLVTNKWLSPNVIAENYDRSEAIVDFIQTQTSTTWIV